MAGCLDESRHPGGERGAARSPQGRVSDCRSNFQREAWFERRTWLIRLARGISLLLRGRADTDSAIRDRSVLDESGGALQEVCQPRVPETMRSASAGPQLPGSYSWLTMSACSAGSTSEH